jgi:hypothetical protein
MLARKYDFDDGVACTIHRFVMSSCPEERNGMQAFEERMEREDAARENAGAERCVPLYKILGFSSLNGFLAHRKQEQRREEAEALKALQNELPEWVLFGYESEFEYCAAVGRERGREGEFRRQTRGMRMRVR